MHQECSSRCGAGGKVSHQEGPLVNPYNIPLSGLIWQTTDWWHFSYFSQKTGFDIYANYLQWRQFAWNVKTCFLGKIRKNISKCCLLKFLPSELSAKKYLKMSSAAVAIGTSNRHNCSCSRWHFNFFFFFKGNGYTVREGNSIRIVFASFCKGVYSKRRDWSRWLSWMSIRLVIRRLLVWPLPGWQHSFVKIDHEIFSTVILSLPLIQEGQLSVSGEGMCQILINCLED